jgi:hypothetical protein
LPGFNARLTKESFGRGSDPRSLPDQPLVLGIGVTERVISGAMPGCHRSHGMLPPSILKMQWK